MKCDDCGRETVALLQMTYGPRYCRRCVFPVVSAKPKGKVRK